MKVMKSMQRKKWHEDNLHLFNDIRFTKLLFRHFYSGSVYWQMKFFLDFYLFVTANERATTLFSSCII